MKNILTFSLLFVVQLLTAQALQISEGQVKHEKDMRPCIEVALAPEPDKVKEAWEGFIKDKYDVKLKGYGFLTNKDVLSAEEVDFKAISAKKMDFYTRIVEEKGQTKMYVFGSFGYDIYINPSSYPLEFKHLEDITKRFLNDYLPGYYGTEIGAVRESLEGLREEKGKMEEEIKNNKEEIEKLTKRNDELAKELTKKDSSIEEKARLLQTKEADWSGVKDKLDTFGLKKD